MIPRPVARAYHATSLNNIWTLTRICRHLWGLENGGGAGFRVVVRPVAEGAVRVVKVGGRRGPDHAAIRGQHSPALCKEGGKKFMDGVEFKKVSKSHYHSSVPGSRASHVGVPPTTTWP